MSKKLFGSADIVVDGEVLKSEEGSAKLSLGGKTRNPRQGAKRTQGFSTTVAEATVECDLLVPAGFSVKKIHDIEDATITFKCDTGQTYVIREGWCSEPPELEDGSGAKASVKFAGVEAEEVL